MDVNASSLHPGISLAMKFTPDDIWCLSVDDSLPASCVDVYVQTAIWSEEAASYLLVCIL